MADREKEKGKKLPSGFPSPYKIATIVFWVIVALAVFYAFRAEVKHNGCYIERQNQCISPFYRVAPEQGDDNTTLLQRVENGIRLSEESVFWRRTLLSAIIISIVIAVVAFRRFPTPVEFIVSLSVTYIILLSIQNWMNMHIWYRVQEQQLRTVNQLRVNLGVLDASTKSGIYGPRESTGFVY